MLHKQLLELETQHGPGAALLPGCAAEKSVIDKLIQELVLLNDVASTTSGDVSDEQATLLRCQCLGTWELVYASNGTVRAPYSEGIS
eukprot:364772-Chlamydomonas_euryale.AAC.18